MNEDHKKSITRSIRVFVWLFGIFLITTTILGIAVLDVVIDIAKEVYRDNRTRVVVASTDLPAGTIITTNNIGIKTFLDEDLVTDDWVSPADHKVLLGHKMTCPATKLEPIEWHKTDIVITNK